MWTSYWYYLEFGQSAEINNLYQLERTVQWPEADDMSAKCRLDKAD